MSISDEEFEKEMYGIRARRISNYTWLGLPAFMYQSRVLEDIDFLTTQLLSLRTQVKALGEENRALKEALEDIAALDDEGHSMSDQRYQDIRWAQQALEGIVERKGERG